MAQSIGIRDLCTVRMLCSGTCACTQKRTADCSVMAVTRAGGNSSSLVFVIMRFTPLVDQSELEIGDVLGPVSDGTEPRTLKQ